MPFLDIMIEIVPAYNRKEEIARLFSEYTMMLIELDPEAKDCLNAQNFDDEILHFDEKYGEPYGRLYIALCDGKTAGCVALRKLDDDRCEMKRLFVRPTARGGGIGNMLVSKLISDAKEIGYREMLLDTLPCLESAIRLYTRMGFTQTERYNDSPKQETIYYKYDLQHV